MGLKEEMAYLRMAVSEWLKSDQDGIERFFPPCIFSHPLYVEIRPRWD